MFSSDSHHIWNEYEWESHINEMARRYEHLRDLIENDQEKRPRWFHHLRDAPTKLDAVDAFIEEELLIEESHFPLDDDQEYNEDQYDPLFGNTDDEDWDPEEDEGDFFEDYGEGDDLFDDSDDEDEDEIESLFEDIFEEETSETSMYDYASLENIAIYTDARDFAADLLVFNDSKPDYMKHPGFIRLVSGILLISSKLAAAYSMGFDIEVLGANITYCKQALSKANQTLEHLQSLKENPFSVEDYHTIHRRLFALRNDIAIHIQETRNFFHSQL